MSFFFPEETHSPHDQSPSPLEEFASGTAQSTNPNISPNSSPAPSSPPPSNKEFTATTAQHMINGFAQRFRLPVQRRNELLALYQIGASLGGSPSDSMQRAYTLACHFASEVRIIEAMNSATQNSDSGKLNELIKELTIRLEDSWQLTNEQKTNTQLVCQDLVYKPKRMNFKNLDQEVIKKIVVNPEKYRLDNVVNRPARKKKWERMTRRLASDARNSLRQQLRDSVFGEKKCTHEQYTKDQAVRYRTTSSEEAHLIQNIILRRFVRENPALVDREENEEASSEAEGSLNNNGQAATTKKRKRTKPGRGRIAEGDDFWAKVDSWFAEMIEKWGESYNGAEWTLFIKESIKLERAEFAPKNPDISWDNPMHTFTGSAAPVRSPSSASTVPSSTAAPAASAVADTTSCDDDGSDWMRNLINGA